MEFMRKDKGSQEIYDAGELMDGGIWEGMLDI
jgi:hypothetical protein